MHHPHIAAVYGVVLSPSRTLLVMERGAEGSLRDLLRRTSLSNLPWLVRTRLTAGVASGVDFLHAQRPPSAL